MPLCHSLFLFLFVLQLFGSFHCTETFDFKSIKGRYVNIFLPGNRKNSLCIKSRCLQVRVKRREKVVCLCTCVLHVLLMMPWWCSYFIGRLSDEQRDEVTPQSTHPWSKKKKKKKQDKCTVFFLKWKLYPKKHFLIVVTLNMFYMLLE